MPQIEVNGIPLYYELHGPPDAEVLVLSNGILMGTSSWGYQTRALSQRYRLLLYDCRGMWQSEHPAGPYSMELHADDLAGLLEALDIERAHVGGISYGGEVSLVFALRYPQKTRSLIAAAAVSQIDPLLWGISQTWLAAIRARDPELFFQVTYPLNFSEAWIAAHPDLLKSARERYKSFDYEALLELMLAFCRIDITRQLSQIEAPTLVLVGEEDVLKPRKYAEIIAREIPRAHLVVVPQAGHALMWEQADVFNALLLGFLAIQSEQA